MSGGVDTSYAVGVVKKPLFSLVATSLPFFIDSPRILLMLRHLAPNLVQLTSLKICSLTSSVHGFERGLTT